MRVAIALFDRVGEVRTENGMLGLLVDATFEELPSPEVVLIPGGIGSRALLADERVLGCVSS